MPKRKVNLSKPRKLFEKQGKIVFWARIEQALAYWVKIVKTSKSGLAKEDKIDCAAYAKAVSKATGRNVSKVIFVSLKNPFPKPEWMTEEVFKASLWDSLGASLWDSLRASLRDSLRASLWDSLGDSLWDSLGASLRASLGASLWDSLGDSLGDSLRDSTWDSLEESIFYTCGFALVGDEEKLEKLLAILKVQEQAIGLGFKEGEPKTFIALCA